MEKTSALNFLKGTVQKSGFYPLVYLMNGNDSVFNLFESYGYTLDGIPGSFLKIGTAVREIGIVEDTLREIENLGLTSVFNDNILSGNILIGFFSNVVASRRLLDNIREDKRKGLAITDEEGNLLPHLFTRNLAQEKEVNSPELEEALAHDEEVFSSMDVLKTNLLNSDKGVEKLDIFNEINQRLKLCAMSNSDDDLLAKTIEELPYRLYERVLHEEYRFPTIYEMVANSINDLILENPASERVSDLILSYISGLDETRNGELGLWNF